MGEERADGGDAGQGDGGAELGDGPGCDVGDVPCGGWAVSDVGLGKGGWGLCAGTYRSGRWTGSGRAGREGE
jgi:hypothetical protein